MNRPPILITGSHRSGTTWVGQIMGKSPWLKYIHEPFNPSKFPNAPLNSWFQYISKNTTDQNFQQKVRLHLQELNQFSFYRFIVDIKKATYFSQLLRFGSQEIKGIYARPLYKDPIAVFSAEWFFESLNAKIIVCIRHPAAFVSSLKNLGWTFNFDELIKQEGFENKYL